MLSLIFPANNDVLAPLSLTLLRHFVVVVLPSRPEMWLDAVWNVEWEPSKTMMIDCGTTSPVFCFVVVNLSA